MANTTETVFVEFVVDDSQIETAQQTLERNGQIDAKAAAQFKATNAELARRQQTIDNLNKQLKATEDQNAKTIAALEAKVESFITDFVTGFSEGIVDTLKEAGFEFDEFGKIINKNNDSTKKSSSSLRGELKALNLELAQMKLRGEDNTQQYAQLAKRAGEIKDAIGDAANEINNFASDTSKLDGAIQTVQGLAGAFGVAQGTIGLFTDDSEKLQEVLLKVNSALAILQGLQTIGNALQKESAAATFLNTSAQQIYNLVIGESIGLLKAFRIALALTGIGAVVIGLTFLIEWMQKTSKATKALTQDFQKFNFETERDINNLNEALQENGRTQDENIARLKANGAKESEINKLRLQGLLDERDGLRDLEESQRSRADEARQTLTEMATGERAFNEVLADEAQKTIDNFEKTGERRKDIANQVRIQAIENEKQLRVERLQAIADGIDAQLALARKNSANELSLAKQSARAQAAVELEEAGQNLEKRLLIEANLRAKIRDLDRQYAIVRQQDAVTAAELQFEKIQAASKDISERGSQAEIDAEKKVIAEKARLDLLQAGLTQQQITAIRERALEQQIQLQKEYNKQSAADALNDEISRNTAELQQLNLTNERRLELTETNLIAQAQLEIDAVHGQADKILEIRAKLAADIRAVRLANIQQSLADELALTTANTGALRRANERIVADQRKTLNQRISAINEIAQLDIAANHKQRDALAASLHDGLISQKDYNIQYAKLKDEELKIVEETEAKKRELQLQTAEKNIQFTADTANQVLQIIQQFGQQQTDAEQARIDAQRTHIQDLQDAGEITEQEATARNKRLDAEENALKRKQAQRDKAIALFQAIINTAAAVAKALLEGGPVFAAIVGALGAAQIALIASRPLPKFAKGKKDRYEGPAEIGESGAELWQHNGEMYLAKSKSVVWIGANDKVFNARETSAMLERGNMRPYIIKDKATNEYKTVGGITIDYDKLGNTIAKNIPQFGLDINEKGMFSWVKRGGNFERYLDNRRGYK